MDYCVNVVAIPKPEDRGLRVAVLASVVSSIVILAMSVSFIICCLQERMSKGRAERTDGRGRYARSYTLGKKRQGNLK